ncbi:hypothetical protein EMIT0P291_160022 [Pseudomonas sp. IT-P291]
MLCSNQLSYVAKWRALFTGNGDASSINLKYFSALSTVYQNLSSEQWRRAALEPAAGLFVRVRQLQDSEVGLAESGQGIALANEVLVREELHSGKLVRVVDAQVKLESYRVLTPSAELSADVAWFIDWLKSELEQDFPEAVIRV